MTTVLDICERALDEIAWRGPDETISAEDAATCVTALNGLLRGLSRQGVVISYPSGKTWKGRWRAATSYAVDDAVLINGTVYVCTAAHTSDGPIAPTNRPGSSPSWATYWSRTSTTALVTTDTLTVDEGLEEGLAAMLAERIAPAFGQPVSPLTHQKAREGSDAFWATYNPDSDQELESTLTTISTSIRRWW